MLTNSAGHDFDAARWLLDVEIETVHVRGLCSRPDLPAGTRDLLLVELGLSNGCLGTVELYANAGYAYEVYAELVCQRGTALTAQGDRVLLRAAGQRAYGMPGEWLERFQEAYVAELRAWVESLRSPQAAKIASAWDGYTALRVSAASIRALKSGGEVCIDLPARPELYT